MTTTPPPSREHRPPAHREDRIHRTEVPGAPPGTLTVEAHSPAPTIEVFAYGADDLIQRTITAPDDIRPLLERWPVTWVNVNGLGDTATISALGEVFGTHPLTLEDVVHVDQRPKLELFPEYLFVVLRAIHEHHDDHKPATEQLSMIIGDRFVVTFQEGEPGGYFDPVRARLMRAPGQIRHRGADWLAYSLIDVATDHMFPILERCGHTLDELELEVMGHPHSDIISRIHELKRELSALRRSMWPQRDVMSLLSRETSPLIAAETRLHLRDVSDHTAQLIDLLDSYKEQAASLIDTHLALSGNRMNEVMKVLTVIGSVFIPLTFITGLYGMNFNTEISPFNMPELGWRYGYPAALGAMVLTVISLMVYFIRRGWMSSPKR